MQHVEQGGMPSEPVSIEVRAGGVVLVDGVAVDHDGSRSPHEVATDAVADRVARPLQRPVRAVVSAPTGRTSMVVHPDGSVTDVHLETGPSYGAPAEVDDRTRPRGVVGAADRSAPTPAPVITSTPLGPASAPSTSPSSSTPATPTTPSATPPPPAPSTPPAFETRAARRAAEARSTPSRSFLTRNEEVEPARHGLRGLLGRLGLATGPSPSELAERHDVQLVSRHWPGPRTIAVVNGKGGAGKTPTTVLLSAVLARHGGSGVLAWDNNETRGTLGWRTEQGPHEAHVLDLLPHAERLMQPTARAADLAAFVHHQTHDKFDVLRSDPAMLPHQQRLTAQDFDAVHQVATKYFRLIVVDSGNDETAPHWLRMVDHADQLVLATTTRPDHAEAGRLLLKALRVRDERSARLAGSAVAVVSQADREEASADTIAAGYDGLVRATVTVPYDRALRAPWLRLDRLQPTTRRAYLRAAAAVAEGL